MEKQNEITLNNLRNSTSNPNNFKRTIRDPPKNKLLQPIENQNLNNNKIVSLIVTHNGRMQCLLKELLKIDGQYQKIRFQNCAIIRVELQKDKPLSIDLVYEGEITKFEVHYGQSSNSKVNLTSISTNGETNIENSELLPNSGKNTLHNNFKDIKQTLKNKKKYYSNHHNNYNPKILKVKFDINNCSSSDSSKICNKLLRCVCSKNDAKPVNFKNINSNSAYVFYIIRHAEGDHNLMNFPSKVHNTIKSIYSKSKIKDPILTEAGILQAKNAGNNLYNILLEKGDSNINYLFVSDLFRTRMTMAIICERLLYNSELNKNKKQIIIQQPNFINGLITMTILPCSHEIDYKGKGGECNGDLISAFSGSGLENTPDIYYQNNKVKIKKDEIKNIYDGLIFKINNDNVITLSKYTFLSDLEEYLKFYSGIRGQFKKITFFYEKKHCRTTNMIETAFNIIKTPTVFV